MEWYGRSERLREMANLLVVASHINPLTVIEAMSSGLPTFATKYGGPLEIIEDGVSGFHIDPNHGDETATSIVEL